MLRHDFNTAPQALIKNRGSVVRPQIYEVNLCSSLNLVQPRRPSQKSVVILFHGICDEGRRLLGAGVDERAELLLDLLAKLGIIL